MSAIVERIAQDFATAHAPGVDSGLASERHSALRALEASGLPSSRDENWKYANLRSLERVRFVPAAPAGTLPAALQLPHALPGTARYIFVDGRLLPGASAPLAAGMSLVSPGERPRAGGAASSGSDERFALLNAAFATQGLRIEAASGGGAPSQVEVLFIASAGAQSGGSYPRLEVCLAPGAHLTLIERHLGAVTEGSFVTSAVHAEIDRGACLEHYRLQDLDARSTFFDTLSAELAQEAVYRLHAINTGAQSARSTLALRLRGERAELELAVASLGDRQQVQDAYAVVEHIAPNARTAQSFRGIAAARARVAFTGKIIVAPGAHGTDSRQSLRGLLAGPEAEIDVRPQLEIYTDDVRCSHGATAGKLDENMLFYMLARGLDRDTAGRLLKWAFLEDVVARVTIPALRRGIEQRLAGQLREADQLKEML